MRPTAPDPDNETVAIGERVFRLCSALPVQTGQSVEAAACCRSIHIPGSDVIATREHTNMGVRMLAWGPSPGTAWTIRSLAIEPGLSPRLMSDQYLRAFQSTHLRFRGTFRVWTEGCLAEYQGDEFVPPFAVRARETLSLSLSCPKVSPLSVLFVRLLLKVTVSAEKEQA